VLPAKRLYYFFIPVFLSASVSDLNPNSVRVLEKDLLGLKLAKMRDRVKPEGAKTS
jgi:hypothetical protein